MDGDDAAGQIAIGHLAEARLAQPRAQRLLIGEGADGRGEIFVHAGPVLRDQGADLGQERERVPIVEAAQPGARRSGELQADEAAARLEHAMDLAEGRPEIAHVAHAKSRGHGIEARLREAQVLRVDLHAGDPAPQAARGHFPLSLDQHGVIEIRRHDAPAGLEARLDQQRQIGGAGPDIQDSAQLGPARGLHGREPVDHLAFPPVMEPEAQERVVQVVPAGDGREHPLHGLLARLAGPTRHHLRRRRCRRFFQRWILDLYHGREPSTGFDWRSSEVVDRHLEHSPKTKSQGQFDDEVTLMFGLLSAGQVGFFIE